MKLYYSNTSPYSRKVRLVVIEKGLQSQVEEVLVNPFEESLTDNNTALVNANPLGKIPTLLLDNGKALFDSPVICNYLDSLSDSLLLIPADETRRLDVLRWEALADGMTDAAYNLVMEQRRPVSEQSSAWQARWASEIHRTLEYIEKDLDQLGDELTLAHLSLAAAMGYLDFRLAEVLYKVARPKGTLYPKALAWYESFNTKLSMITTLPHD